MNDEVMERLIDTLMELQKKESTDLPLLKKQLAETEKGINNMLNASEPHMAKVTCFSAVLNGKTKYRRIRQYLRIRADTHFFHTGYGWFPHYR